MEWQETLATKKKPATKNLFHAYTSEEFSVWFYELFSIFNKLLGRSGGFGNLCKK